MARLDQRDPRNVDGAWFVDTRCIDCDTCRELVPDLFDDAGGQSVVVQQPTDAGAERRAWLAAEACPTQSIGRAPRSPRPTGLYPLLLDGPVSYLGHTSEDSFGADSYLVQRPDGNLMVDSPRFTRRLVEPIEEMGGLAHIMLTHRDDVADADRWAREFGARVWIHEDDRTAAPCATDLLHGLDVATVARGVLAVPVPGHTRGSVVYAVDENWLFSGDSLAWSRERDDLTAFRGACWYSWSEQTASLRRLADTVGFSWLLPGHGGRAHRPHAEMHARLTGLVARMR
ncbi:MAG: MBL fold metallo-hydrolase, partial [Actinomycetota bacterium]|nr:MBL fold metallo-hydrolase [Actinomycetota bacterium]